MAGGFRRWGRLFQLPCLAKRFDDPRMAGATRICRRTGSVEPRRLGGDGFVLRLRDSCPSTAVTTTIGRICTATRSSRFRDLRDVIIPFFQANPLRTAKRENFAKFVEVVGLMELRRHLTVSGLIEIAEITQTMNFRKSSEVLRILRDHTPTLFPVSGEEDDMVRSLRRRREVVRNGNPPLRK